MSALTAEQRGDLAEAMLPVAAHLAVLVHGDGGPEDVQEVLDGLDVVQRTALIVVLAGLVDPEQPLSRALGWSVSRCSEQSTVRSLADEMESDDGEFVDEVAIQLYVNGRHVELSDTEFIRALELAAVRGLTVSGLDRLQGVPGRAGTRAYRLRKKLLRAGKDLPAVLQTSGKAGRLVEFTDGEVVEIREKYARGGITDLELSMQYGRTRKSISSLLSGTTYRSAGGPIRKPRSSKPSPGSREGFARNTGPSPTADLAQAQAN